MFPFLLKKLARNPLLSACMLFGLIVAVALVSSIPMYTDGVLQRLFLKDVEGSQLQSGQFPGRCLLKKKFVPQGFSARPPARFADADRAVAERIAPEISPPVLLSTRRRAVSPLYVTPESPRAESARGGVMELAEMEGMESHVRLVHGRVFGAGAADGVLEGIVSERTMRDGDIRLGEVYRLADIAGNAVFRVRVVGVFTIKEPRDLFWYRPPGGGAAGLYVPWGSIDPDKAGADGFSTLDAEWYFALDYHEISVAGLPQLLSRLKEQTRFLDSLEVQSDIPLVAQIELYLEKARGLRLTLLFLQVPVLVMLAFFLSTVSKLVVDGDRNEIAVLKSRGWGTRQVFLLYLMTALLLAGAALAAGTAAGVLLCRVIGLTNGFIEFVRRASFPVSLSPKAVAYALTGSAFFLCAVLLPALRASRTTIVLHKQRSSRADRSPLWKRAFLDIVLLAVAGYGLYGHLARQRILALTGLAGSDLPVDPLAFLVSVCFILGSCLLCLRLFPLFIRLVFRVGKRAWSAALYASFLHIGRSGGYENSVFLFLILTMAIGVFNSNAARSMNKNIEDSILYANGAHLVIEPMRIAAAGVTESSFSQDMKASFETMEALRKAYPGLKDVVALDRPTTPSPGRGSRDSETWGKLDGVRRATRVIRARDVPVRSSRDASFQALVMGVVPSEFAAVAWLRPGLLPGPLHRYLSLLGRRPDALLVSQSLREEYGIEAGQRLAFSVDGGNPVEGVVSGFVAYWPSFNPLEVKDGQKNRLIVANRQFLETGDSPPPAEIWIQRDAKVPVERLYADMVRNGLDVVRVADSDRQILERKDAPAVEAVNGVLTLGFLVTMAVSFTGFLICWTVSVQGRTLQFGVFRALGLAGRSVLAILASEQLLISGTSLAGGTLIGGIAAQLFVPMMSLASKAADQVPPYLVGAFPRDYGTLFLLVAGMMALALAVIGAAVSRLRISQALKLGEE